MVTTSNKIPVKTELHYYITQTGNDAERKDARGNGNAAIGASAEAASAIRARLLTFYFGAPAKAFFRTRVE